MTHQELADDLRRVWSKSTSAQPDEWTQDNPALGQCAVTALVVQDRFGGDLLRSTVGGMSHYWNRLPSGEEIDLTLDQFGPGASYDAPPVVRDREYVLSFQATTDRYDLLTALLEFA